MWNLWNPPWRHTKVHVCVMSLVIQRVIRWCHCSWISSLTATGKQLLCIHPNKPCQLLQSQLLNESTPSTIPVDDQMGMMAVGHSQLELNPTLGLTVQQPTTLFHCCVFSYFKLVFCASFGDHFFLAGLPGRRTTPITWLPLYEPKTPTMLSSGGKRVLRCTCKYTCTVHRVQESFAPDSLNNTCTNRYKY